MDRNIKPIDQETNIRMIKLALLGVAFAILCMLFLLMFTWFQPDQLSLSDRYFPSPTATLTPSSTPTPTPTPNLTATLQANQAAATSLANQWNILLSDSFETNDRAWDVGNDTGEYADMSREISKGTYLWTVTVHKGFIGWQRLETSDISDFILSVDARETRNPNIGEYGLVFREDRDGNFYYFGINFKMEFFVLINYKGDRQDLIVPTYCGFIRPAVFNHLTVVAQGAHFMFFINGHYAAEVTDERIKSGITAMAVSLDQTNRKSIFEFDNIELRTP